MIRKIVTSFVAVLALSGVASAHVVVKPAEVQTAAFQTFTVGVPVEKDVATTSLRLVIPAGLKYVTPTVKQGWTINVAKEGEGSDAKVTEIIWTGGQIPAGQRDDFTFSAQAPAEETELQWKAYQTYADGSVVAWEENPSANHDDHESKPYSVTKVLENAVATNASSDNHIQAKSAQDNNAALALSVMALVLSVVAFARPRK